MNDERDEIRRRVDLVSLVGSEIPLKRNGKTFKGLCPFHDDRNPSFTVSAETGRYKCWSCGESGDVFTWVMKRRNVDFAEALTTLAKLAGVTLTTRGGPPASQRQEWASAMEDSLAFFRSQLQRSTPALEYCANRNLPKDVLDLWEMGYAPDVGDALASHLKKGGHSLTECKSLFLVDQDARGGYFDKFRGRLMFPIRDERGELVAFGGRLLGTGNPKYINSGDTPLYRKSRVLYGMNLAKVALNKGRQAVLVEGYLDVIACHRAGVTQALASLGTSLAEDHAKLLARWTDEVVILYDSDAAGQKASARAVGILQPEALRVRVALMPEGDDPDTLLNRDGPAGVIAAVKGALLPLDYQLQAIDARLSPDTDQYWVEAVEALADAENHLELDKHLVKLASRYPGFNDPRAAQTALRKQVTLIRRTKKAVHEPGKVGALITTRMVPLAPLHSAEVVVFTAFLTEEHRELAWPFVCKADLFLTARAAALSTAISTGFGDAMPTGPVGNWLHVIEPESARQELDDLIELFHGKNLHQEAILQAVERLHKERMTPRFSDLANKQDDPDAKNEFFLRLVKSKPAYQQIDGPKDSLF